MRSSGHRNPSDLYRVVADPTGKRFEIEASDVLAEAVSAPLGIGTGLMLSAIVKRVRGMSWRVEARRADVSSTQVLTRYVRSREEAMAAVFESAVAIESGQLQDPG